MIYRFWECPVAPRMLSVAPSADGTSAVVRFTFDGDQGGTAITRYRLQRATNSAFTQNVVTITSSGTSTITGLTPGTRYYYRALACNYVTDVAGKLGGPWASAINAVQPDPGGFGRIRSGSS